jgi:putative transposase
MNRPRCTETDFIGFLVATPRAVSGTEAARVQPRRPADPAHDAFTRLLHRLEPDPAALWQEVAPLVERAPGVLVVDDTTLDKPYARAMELVPRHWSGKHHAVVDGINLITLLWTEEGRLIPCDWRVFDKPNDGMTKNEHFLAMLLTAKQRGFAPAWVN